MGDLAYWPAAKPLSKKNTFAKNRDFIKNLDHIDQIWEKLKFKCGDTLAVCDLRGKYKEKFSYSELADLITKVSFSFKNYGLVKGDVVTVISENSPRWLLVDQGLMRLGAINAVRGINSHSREGFTGVWIGNKKIASIGIGCKRWITINGFSINIDCELENFNKIVPCGIENCLMANMIDYNKNLNIQEVKRIVKKIIQEEFNFDFVSK